MSTKPVQPAAARQAVQPVVSGNVPVVYIHPAKQGIRFDPENIGRPYGVIPVGAPALINTLRAQGIRVRGVNYPMEKQRSPKFDLGQWVQGQRGVRVILIDMHWYEHTYGAVETARLCKQVAPWAWTILGGLTASGFARQIMENIAEVDFVVRGDAEQPLLALTQRLLQSGGRAPRPVDVADIPNLTYRANGQVIENPLGYIGAPSDLDALDFVDISFLAHAQEYHVHEYIVTDIQEARANLERQTPFLGRWLCTARGCQYHCSYCGGDKNAHKILAGRSGLVTRSPEKIVDDLKRLARAGVHQASMSYDIAELGRDYWETLFLYLRESGVRIGIYNEFFQKPTPDFIQEFAQCVNMPHSCVAVSPLSGNERVRRLNGKHYSNEQLFETLSALRLYPFHLFVYFSLNLPGETEETLEETVGLARKIYEFYPLPYLKILNTVHTLDPLSPMSVSPEKYGIQVNATSFMDFYAYCRDTQLADPAARNGLHRGFELAAAQGRDLERMANRWDAERRGREISWWPIPPSW